MRKIAIVIPTYNRPDYLRQCLDSLSAATLPKETNIYLIDDGSKNSDTLDMVTSYTHKGANVSYSTNNHLGVCHQLQVGFNQAVSEGNEILINLDSDAIVSENFVEILIGLLEKFPDHIITGFDTRTTNRDGSTRHKIIEDHTEEGYVTKRTIGGINMVMTPGTYEAFVKPALKMTAKKGGNWDHLACHEIMKMGKPIICAVPSQIEHIGIQSSMGHGVHEKPDTAYNFKGLQMPEEKEVFIISQFQGIGDILFSIPLVEEWIADGHKIVWPVISDYVGLNKHFDQIQFIDKELIKVDHNRKEEYHTNGARVIPLRWSDQIMKVPFKDVMKAKYQLYGSNWRNWRNVKWKRDMATEEKIFKSLGLKKGQKFNLINKRFRSDQSGMVDIKIDNGLQNIEMRNIPGTTLLDWGLVIERAEEIHTVHTAVVYIIDVLETTDKLHQYLRKPDEKDFSFTDYLWRKKYQYHF